MTPPVAPEPAAPTGSDAPLSRAKTILFGAILAALVLGVMEAASIWYLRAFQGYDGYHLYQYVYDPYKNILPTPGYVDTRGVRHNSAGFRRSTEVSRLKPADTYRIFLMGASAAYGLGGQWPNIEPHFPVLKNSETIDAYLERELSSVLPDRTIEVINAAVTSTWTHHELIYLNQTILNYQPDMVLFFDGYNDFFQLERNHDQFGSYSYNLPGRIVLGEPTAYALAYGAGWWLFRKWALFNVIGRGGRILKVLFSSRPDRSPMPPLDTTLAILHHNFPRSALAMQRRSGAILREEGVKTVYLLQPMLILERDRPGNTPLEKRLVDFNASSYKPGYEAFMRAAIPWIRDQESQMARSVGAEFIDLTTVFLDTPNQVYTDYCHMTPYGNEIIARAIAARIAPWIARPASAAIGHP
jgi:lysophospholipase L1-like esterase